MNRHCTECLEEIWDEAHGSKLAKCWNTDSHADGGTLAMMSPLSSDEVMGAIIRCHRRGLDWDELSSGEKRDLLHD